jgi:hypothetical protein
MLLIQLVVVLVVIGLLLWLVETQLPIDPTIKRILHVVVIVAVVLWLLAAVGLLPLRPLPLTP